MSTIESQSAPASVSPPQMSTTDEMSNAEFEYRSISAAAIACCVFAILGITSFLSPVFVILPLVGVICGFIAISRIRKFPDELLGINAARVGTVASIALLLGSLATHAYIYATEVPDGYQRISFWDLRDNQRTPLPFAERARELDGKKVFLKGYVRPGARKKGLKEFILVGDFGDCCFGGNPSITEIVEVDIKNEKTVDYSLTLRKIGGVFHLNKNGKAVNEKDIPQVLYTIEADYIR